MDITNKRQVIMEYFTIYSSPLGLLYLTAGEDGLTGLTFSAPDALPQWDGHPAFRPVRQWLDDYFRGAQPPIAALPLCLKGTKFQLAVWESLTQIPYGKTRTYGEIAKALSQNMSPQAVGQAVGANPISILIPCHRVVGAGGKLTGYAWGLEKKIWLLRHEGILKEETQ